MSLIFLSLGLKVKKNKAYSCLSPFITVLLIDSVSLCETNEVIDM